MRMYLTFVTEGKTDSQLQLQVSQWQASTGLQPEVGEKTILVHLDTGAPRLGLSAKPICVASAGSQLVGLNLVFFWGQG